jgi:hypothetical protein
LVADLREALAGWQADLKNYVHQASSKHHPGKLVIDAALTRIAKQLAIRDAFEFVEAMLTAKNDWLDTSEDIHDVGSFYKTQLPTWSKMLDALIVFAENRDILQKNPTLATSLADLEAIRDNPTPYGQIPRIDALIKTVEAANEAAAQTEREQALISIDAKIAEVIKSLDQVQAAPELRNKTLHPLQELKTKLAGLSSIPKIRYMKDQAGNLLDDAMAAIEAAMAKPVPPPESGKPPPSTSPTPTPKVKTTKAIKASDLTTKVFLETEADVDAYVAKLKDELMSVINAGQRARIH